MTERPVHQSAPPGQSCAACAFYFEGATPPDYLGVAGECHAQPPWPGTFAWGSWPAVQATSWCGQFKQGGGG